MIINRQTIKRNELLARLSLNSTITLSHIADVIAKDYPAEANRMRQMVVRVHQVAAGGEG